MSSPIPISALEHHRYCPRQCALIHVDGVWVENRHTVRGSRGHRRADELRGRTERGRMVLRGIPLWSETLGLTGRADAVEVYSDGGVVPVEYKVGRRHGDAADVQVCAQGLCLEEMLGVAVDRGAVWFTGTRRRIAVDLDDDLRRRTIETIECVRRLLTEVLLPEAPNDERCGQCQLLDHCLPGVVGSGARFDSYMAEVYDCDS